MSATESEQGLPRLDNTKCQPKGFNRPPGRSIDGRDTAESGIGWTGNRHLSDLVESIIMNVGRLWRDDKVSSPPMLSIAGGVSVVVRDRESLPQGEGRQFVEISGAEVTEC